MRSPLKIFGGGDPIATLEGQRDRLSREWKAAVSEADAAVAARTDLLVMPDSTDTALKTAAKRVRTANGDRAAIEEALQAVERMLADAYAAREAEKDRGERQRLAVAVNARADRIAAACAALDKAGQAFAKAREAAEAVISADGLVPELWGGGPLYGPVMYAAARVVLPSLVDMDRERARIFGQPFRVGAVEAANDLQIAPLRAAAQAIVDGTAPAISPSMPLSAPPDIRFDETSIVLSESVEWRGVNGMPIVASEGGVTLPVPVAEAAVAARIGHAPDSMRGQAILRELQRGEPSATGVPRNPNAAAPIVRRGPPHKTLPVNLYEIIQTERARLARNAA